MPLISSETPDPATTMDEVTIEGSIRLGQLLKLADLAETGAEAKELLRDGVVRVNTDIETRRGRQLRIGDVIQVGERSVRLR